MTSQEAQAMYAAWRFDMWTKGYGTYTEIDAKVSRRELTPGRDYPPIEADAREEQGQ